MSPVGTYVGRILVQSLLGRGGMGEVYVGYDETLGRQVALKSILSKYRLSAETKKRFLREARVLSQLDHPNICRIYDFIETDEGDFLVLELIEGRSLNLAIAEGMDPGEQMKVAEQVAQALVSAHSEGVVHRDLKPSNVILTEDGGVKVLDFGLARPMDVGSAGISTPAPAALGPDDPTEAEPLEGLPESGGSSDSDEQETLAFDADSDDSDEDSSIVSVASQSASEHLRVGLRTKQGKVIGTPTYMSPEQARGEPITTASDMYSYGLLLQTMFTGKRPYPLELQREQLLRRVRRADTLPVEGVDAELAKLVERLKSEAPAARPTAVTVVEGLHWIADRPKRRLRRLLGSAAVVVAMAAGLKYTLDLRRERSIAVEAREEADRRRGQAEDLIGFMVNDLRQKLEPLGQLDILDEVGDQALDYFAAVNEKDLTSEELFRRTKALTQIGDVRMAQGALVEARRTFDEALVLASDLVARSPDNDEWLAGLGAVHFWIGFVELRQNELDAAEVNFREYLKVAERLLEIAPDNPDWQLELAYAHSNIGTVLSARGDSLRALEHFRLTADLHGELVGRDPSETLYRRELARTLSWIGEARLSSGDLKGALDSYLANLETMEQLSSLNPENRDWLNLLGIAYGHVGVVRQFRGELADSLDDFVHALQIHSRQSERDPTNARWRRQEALALRYVGSTRLLLGESDESQTILERAVEMMESLYSNDESNVRVSKDLARSRTSLGHALLEAAQPEASLVLAENAAATMQALLLENPDDPDAASRAGEAALLGGDALASLGRGQEARERWRVALSAFEALAEGSSDPRLLDLLVRSLIRLDHLDEARGRVMLLAKQGYRDLGLVRLCGDNGLGGLLD